MLEKDFNIRWQKTNSSALTVGLVFLISASGLIPGTLFAQADSSASGMTTGLPGVSPAREAELMHIRARAQAAKPEAEAAAMRRSAEKALDQKANQRLLNEARETKKLKEQAARNLEYQKAANAFKKVSRSDIEAYSSNNGRVKVQQEVPSAFLASLPPEEEPEKKPGFFSPVKNASAATFGAAKKAVSWVPFVGKKDESDYIEPPAPEQASAPVPVRQAPVTLQPARQPEPLPGNVVDTGKDKDGMFKKMGNLFKRDKDYIEPPAPVNASVEEEKEGFFKGMGSAIPFMGKKKKEEEIVIKAADPAYAGGNVPANTAPVPPPGSPLFGPQSGATARAPVPPPPVPANSMAAAPSDTAPSLIEPEKKGMFSGLKNLAGKLKPGGKNKSMAGGPGNIDSSLFPESGDSGSQLMADTSGIPAEKKKLKMPSLPANLIPAPQKKAPEAPKPPMPKKDRSPLHSGGSDLYIVQGASTQFLRFGDSTMGSETQSLQAGTVVRMTKVGDEWSSVQLSNGSTGIVRNKALRPANSGERGVFPGATGTPSPPIASTSNSARITRPVSATGAALKETPGTVGPPVSIPESRLTSGGTNSGIPQ